MGKAILGALLVCGKILLFALLAVLVLVVLLLCARIGFRLRVHADGAVEVLARVGVFYPNITKLATWRAAWRQKPKKPKILRYTQTFGLFGEAPEKPQKKRKSQKSRCAQKITGEALAKAAGKDGYSGSSRQDNRFSCRSIYASFGRRAHPYPGVWCLPRQVQNLPTQHCYSVT